MYFFPVIGILIIIKKIPDDIDWSVFRLLKRIPKLQTSSYLVLVGWIVAFGG
ncbi:MAG: hypothetical protein LBV17_10725 [Treponema sp.]|nr:hypothetical protein [Treponema sp.]